MSGDSSIRSLIFLSVNVSQAQPNATKVPAWICHGISKARFKRGGPVIGQDPRRIIDCAQGFVNEPSLIGGNY
jgi:hypothetical protein